MASFEERLAQMRTPAGGAAPAVTEQDNSVQDRLAQMRGTQGGAATPSPTPAVSEDKDEDKNLWDKILGFVGFTGEKFASGAAESAEGIYNTTGYMGQMEQRDQAVTNAGFTKALGDIFGIKKLQDIGAQELETSKAQVGKPLETATDFGDKYAAKVEEKYADADIGKVGRFVGDVAQGVGGLVPSIAANAIVPGGGTAALAMGIFGNSMQEAKNSGADDITAAAYGIANTAVETVTEKLLGGMKLGGKKLFGTGFLDKAKDMVLGKVGSSGTKRLLNVALSALGEGAEEFIAEYGNLLANKLTIGTDQRVWNSLETLGDAAYNAFVGGIIGGIMNVGNNVSDGKPIDPKEAAEMAAEEAATEIKNAMPTQGEISPSEGVSAEPTTYTANAENVSRVGPGAPGFETANVDGEQRGESGESGIDVGVGGARAGTVGKETPFKTAPTEDAATQRSNWMSEELRNELAPGEHRVISNEDSLEYAKQYFAYDSETGDLLYEESVDSLLDVPNWTGVEADAAMLLIKEAEKRGDMATVRLLNKLRRDTVSEGARTLQATKKWVSEGGDNIISEASKQLDEAVEAGEVDNAKADETLKEVTELAREYDAAYDDMQKLADLIRKTAVKRKTTGLFSKKLSGTLEKALQRIMERGDIDFLRTLAANGVANIAADTRKVSFGEAAKTMRRQSMLSKIATTMRNLVSNGAFGGTDTLARDISVPLDILLSKFTKTRSVSVDKGFFSEARRKGKLEAMDKSLLEVALDIDTSAQEGAYEHSGNRTFKMSGGVFSRFMSTWEKWEGYALQTTDARAKGGVEAEIRSGLEKLAAEGKLKLPKPKADGTITAAPFKEGDLVRATDRNNFGRVIKYNAESNTYDVHFKSRDGYEANVTLPAEQVVSINGTKHAKVYDNVDDLIADMAHQEALYRTFQDDTKLSRAALGLRDVANVVNIGGEKGIGLGDIILPFAKTPANLASRALEYSPLGMVKSVKDLATVCYKATKGTLTPAEQAQAVQEFGRGFTGSMLIAAAAGLSIAGVIKTIGNGSDDEDKDKTAYDKMSGQNGTQWNLSATMRWLSGEDTAWRDDDVLMNISFLEPFNAMMTTGALLAEDWKNEDLTTWQKIVESAKASPEGAYRSISQLPMFSSFQDFAQNMEYSDAETGVGRFADAAAQYGANQISSFVPNAVKGIAQGIDPIQRNTYAGDNLWEQTLSNVMSGIPGLRSKVEAKTDSFGNEMRNEGGVLNFLNSNILPGYITHYNEQTGSALLDSVYELTGNASIYPDRKAPNSISGTDAKGNEFKFSLDSEAGQKYLATAGAEHEAFLKAAENNAEFSKLSTEEQAAVLTALRSQAHAEAKHEAIADSGHKMELSEADKLKASLPAGALVDYLIAKEKAVIPNNYTSTPTWQKFEIAAAMPESFALDMIIAQGGDTGRRIAAAVDSGVDLDKAIAYYRATTERNGKGENPSKAEENQRIAALGLTAEERGALIRAFNLEFD